MRQVSFPNTSSKQVKKISFICFKVNSCLFVSLFVFILIQVTAVLIKLSSQYRLKNSFVHCDHLILHFYFIWYNCEKCLPQFWFAVNNSFKKTRNLKCLATSQFIPTYGRINHVQFENSLFLWNFLYSFSEVAIVTKGRSLEKGQLQTGVLEQGGD